MTQMNRGNQAGRLIDYIPNMAHDKARIAIGNAYLRACQEHTWLHLLKRFTLQTEAQYSDGTVTASSTTLTGSGTTWLTSWSTAPSMRRVAISGRNEPYDVTISSATVATLADPWVGSTDAGLSYNMFRDTYPLPTDCGMHKMIALYDTQLLYKLSNYAQPRFFDTRAAAPWLTTIPECFTVVNQTSEATPRPQLQFYPAPSDIRVYHGWYFRRPAFPTTDAEFLDWPQEFDDMIWTRALVDHYSMPMHYSPKYLAEWKPRYMDMYRKMKSSMDGQSQIDFEIEQARTGAGGGTWNPDPSGLSGSGFYGSGWSR